MFSIPDSVSVAPPRSVAWPAAGRFAGGCVPDPGRGLVAPPAMGGGAGGGRPAAERAARQVDHDRSAAALGCVIDGVGAVAAGEAVGNAGSAGEAVVLRGAD